MTIHSLSSDDRAKLKNLVDSAVTTMHDIAALKEGLKETVDAVSEELEIDKKVLNKAIRIAFKLSQNANELESARSELDDAEQVLLGAGQKI